MKPQPSVFAFNKSVPEGRFMGADPLLGHMPPWVTAFSSDMYADLLKRNQEWSILVAHITDDMLKDILTARRRAGVLIRVSSQSRCLASHKEGPVHILECRKKYDAIGLSHTEGTAAWADIIGRLADGTCLPGDICEGRIPPALWAYFGSTPIDHIVALCILCQGFLTADNPRAQRLPDALVGMLESRTDLWRKEKPTWWTIVSEAALKDQWGGPLPAAVQQLLTRPAVTVVRDDVVSALNELRTRLEEP